MSGCNGFVGSHLAELLLRQGWKVCGTVRRATPGLPGCLEGAAIFECDVNDPKRVAMVVSETSPDFIFHFASQAYIGPSWADPAGTFRTNILGTLNLLEGVRRLPKKPVTVICGSSSEYGSCRRGEGPISEEWALRPRNPYAVSKVGMTLLASAYSLGHGLPVVGIRPFALIGPRKRNDAVSDFARGIVRIERGEAEDLSVGNLDAVRDFTDVRDGARAIVAVAESGSPGETYNVCSGVGRQLSELLTELIALSGRSVKVRTDPERMRKSDDEVLIGDNRKLRKLGWNQEIPLRQTLTDVLSFWRDEAGGQ